MLKKISQIAALALIITAISGCQTTQHHGIKLKDEDLAGLKINKTTKAELVAKIGHPNYQPTYSKNTWYYVSVENAKRGFFKPSIKETEIYQAQFKNDKLVAFNKLDIEHNNNVHIVSAHEKSRGTELSLFEEFIQNIGRYNPKPQMPS